MLTVLDLSKIIDKSEHIIRYWITHDDNIKSLFRKEIIEFNNNSGTYKKPAWVCDKKDVKKIKKILSKKRQMPTLQKNYWTDIATHCFERHMICKDCVFEQYCCNFSYPPMKTKVLELVEKYGEPHGD